MRYCSPQKKRNACSEKIVLLTGKEMLAANMIGGTKGSIVANVTSKMGSIDDNGSGGSYAYRASKVALNMVTRSFSIDNKDNNIETILLHPGKVTWEEGRRKKPKQTNKVLVVVEPLFLSFDSL